MRLLPADEIDVSALLFFSRAFYLHFGVDKCLRIWYDIGGLEISVAHPVQRIINVGAVKKRATKPVDFLDMETHGF